MPHFNVEYSQNLVQRHDMQALADLICRSAAETGVFPLGGIRVRLMGFDQVAIADGHRDNAFVSIVVRIGQGRDEATKRSAGQAVFDAICDFFADELDGEHFMVSLDMVENEAGVSFKRNTVHSRIKSGSAEPTAT
ncbi:MAG: 5-carboxymethyl-2-hydroxymuconate isomerase [Ahrensia sp.]|nr:5-carboxymethyl-2-hydroxymuconate isomerase [Ahrensia sp.]